MPTSTPTHMRMHTRMRMQASSFAGVHPPSHPPIRHRPPSDAQAASGRYRPEHGIHYRSPRKRLKLLKSNDYDRFLTEEAPPTSLVVVCVHVGQMRTHH